MAKLDKLCDYTAKLLDIGTVPDYGGALNGLQLRNLSGEVSKIAAAVDATLPVIGRAVEEKADLLLVHHGMFWQGAQRIDGAVFERLHTAMAAGLAVYSVHIPLDVHPVYGNNALLAKACGLEKLEPFFPWKGIQLGLRTTASAQVQLRTLVDRVENAVGGPVHVCQGGGVKVGNAGVITGGAGSEIYTVAGQGVDTFITGEGPHWSYTSAEELGVNVIYAGHYATETFGVRSLAEHLADKFKLEHAFIDHPTGL